MNLDDFKLLLLYNLYKDKAFRTSNDLRILFRKRYNVSYKNSNELILKIINYQVDKYGIQLYTLKM
jgi:hypothetical protein